MKEADLPSEEASRPEGGTVQSVITKKKQKNTFEKTVRNEDCFSQQSQHISSYKDGLSLPSHNLSHRERMLWIQKHRDTGLWVQCDDCQKWRYMPHIQERHELPNKWYCNMNQDNKLAKCSAPETILSLREEEDLIYNEYSAGSLVWARLSDWPWWPAMVDDCPDAEQFYWLDGFSDIPVQYHVVFFDKYEITRAWIKLKDLKPFTPNKILPLKGLRSDKLRIKAAIKQAKDAASMSAASRLEKYCFVARYKGDIVTPKKPSKQLLKKFQKELKRKFDIDFTLESSSDSKDNESVANLNKAATKKFSHNATPKKQRVVVNEKQNIKYSEGNIEESQEAFRATELTESDNDFRNNDSSKTDVPEDGLNTQTRNTRMSSDSNDFDF